MLSLEKLVLISLAGTVGCVGIVHLFNNKVSEKIKKTSFYKEAMDSVRQNKGALYLLGHPIRESKASFAGPGMRFRNQSDVKVEVSGPKSDGIVFFSIVPEKDDKKYLSTVQLQIGKDDSKRLVIKEASAKQAIES